jgi:hypothetical protein
MTKNLKKFKAENFVTFFFLTKTTYYLSLGSIKDVKDTEEAFSSQKRHSALQIMKFLNFFSSVVSHF